MKPILLVRNDPVETFGLAVRSLEGAGATVIEFDSADPSAKRPVLADVAGVVMHGGTMNVDEIDAAELEYWLEEASASMDVEEVWGKSADSIRQEATRSLARHEEQGAEVFARFAGLAAELA